MIDRRWTRLDVALLQSARVPQDIGTGYGTVRHLDPSLSHSEQHSRLSEALLSLAHGGLVKFFRAPLAEGYSLSLDEVATLEVKDVIAELALGPEHVDSADDMLFFITTEAGLRILTSLAGRT